MNIALIGYGRMGHEIEAAAVKRGHDIRLVIDVNNRGDLNSKNLAGIDVAIEFTLPDSAFHNVKDCLENHVPVVSGTTGWLENYQKAVEICKINKTAFLHSTNFSIGVNLLFKLNEQLAKFMQKYSDYSVAIEEIHHTKKLDAPSGTALTLVKGITENHSGYDGWAFPGEAGESKIPVTAIREGMVPGTHTVKWDSEIDAITLIHESKNRKGLALGAVIAAEFIKGRSGVFTMNDVMGF
ncbi:MAG TPA: 4-hydroxy-tetrahydrodipicolinate reductase [Bacteroidales bacterium]|jgi:4-hydroxy-tetrahydrodipicolinate reductase|nr:4-hydroxy-tetrahydrodipicolinate reductase [Bacteroidales bacterium]